MSICWLTVIESDEEGIETVRIEQPLDYYDEKRQQRVRNYQPMSWRNINWHLIILAAAVAGLFFVGLNIPGWLTGLWR